MSTRRNDDIRRYNGIAREVMAEYEVPVTDMFAPLHDGGIRNFVQPDGVHLNYRGGALLGELVARAIERHL
jgi:lysophospholipase L1-like esterase